MLGVVFWIAIMLADLDFSLASPINGLGVQAPDSLHSDTEMRAVCKARKAQIGLVLVQYWAYVVRHALRQLKSCVSGGCMGCAPMACV